MRYAGIGSRKTPRNMKEGIKSIAFYLAEAGMILVSGGADGADTFFEQGCDEAFGKKEIWLPEEGFNRRASKLYPSKDAFIVAERYVPHWKKCNAWAKSAHARNCHQILGANLMTPVKFVVCWTPGGEKVGGTATALRIAEDFNVPVMNLGVFKSFEDDAINALDDFFLKNI